MNKVMSFDMSLEGECDICHNPLMSRDFIVVNRVYVTKPFAHFEFETNSYHKDCEGKFNGP